MAIRLLNKKTRKIESFDGKTAIQTLYLEGDKYLPLNGEDYIIKSENGEFKVTDGKYLYRTLGDFFGELVTQEEYAVQMAVKAEYTKKGQFLKSALSEALLLGLNKNKALPEDPLSKAIEVERRKQYGGAETAGSIVGSIIPFIAGGVGGALRAGAKVGAKRALTGKVLQQAGKLPSAQVFKGAGKAGEITKKGIAKLGGTGAKTQAVAGAIGVGVGFAGLEAGIAGTKEAIKTATENEYKTTENTMKSVLGQGYAKGVETFKSTSVVMAFFGGAGLALKTTGKALGYVTGKTPEFLRDRFFGTEFGVRGKKQFEILRKSFGGKQATKTEVLKKADDFLNKEGLKDFKTRDTLLVGIKNKLKESGKAIDEARTKAYNSIKDVDKKIEFVDTYIKGLKGLLKEQKGIKGATINKEFISTVETMIKTLEGYKFRHSKTKEVIGIKKEFKISDIRQIMDVLSRKAKYTKREKAELEIDKVYRKGYSNFSNDEDEIIKRILKKEGISFKGLKGAKKGTFKEEKDFYSQLKTAEEVVDNAMPPGSNFMRGFANFRDLLIVGGGGYGFGPGGVIVGAGISVGIQQAQQKGYKYLQMARRAENVSNYMNRVKNVAGIKFLLNTADETSKQAKITFTGLSTLFFGKTAKTLDEFDSQLQALPPQERYVSGQEDMFSMVEQYGGRVNATNFTVSMAKMKRGIVAIMPQPSFDLKGNKVYAKADTEKFLTSVNQGVSPFGFIKAVQSQKLTQAGFNLFKNNYSSWLSEFNSNFLRGIKTGEISHKEGGYYKSWLKSQNTATSDFIFSYMDREQQIAGQSRPPQRKLRRSEPTISQSIEGGF